MTPAADPHKGQPVLHGGIPLDQAEAVLIMLHGRGATAEDMLGLFAELNLDRLCALAPQAAGRTWYPHSFLAPVEDNQPYLDSAISLISDLVTNVLSTGITSEKVALHGFSQGACLACEFAARHPRRYGAVMALTGGVIGPPGMIRHDSGSLGGTPVFLGTSDPDPHVPLGRVEETKELFTRMGAQVDFRSYPGMPHTVNEEELEVCRHLLRMIINQE